MYYKDCMTCVHKNAQFIDAPCNECGNATQGTGDKWEPDELAQSLIALGRRNGLEEAYKIASEQSVLALRMKLEEALEVK